MGRFTDAVEVELAKKNENRACKFARFLAGLSKPEREEVMVLMGRGDVPHKVLSAVLSAHAAGPLSSDTISIHRRQKCRFCGHH